MWCNLPLYERVHKLYLQGAVILDHQWYCKRCGWWRDGKWEVCKTERVDSLRRFGIG